MLKHGRELLLLLCTILSNEGSAESVFDLTCGKSLKAQVARSGVRSFTLPTFDALAQCPGRFCYLQKPVLGAEHLSEHIPEVAVQQALCLMEDDCSQEDLDLLYRTVCTIPRCSDLLLRDEQSLCMMIQTLECDSRQRLSTSASRNTTGGTTSLRCNTDSEHNEAVIPSLLACGSETLSDMKYLMLSGGLQDLGDFDGCRSSYASSATPSRQGNNYCTVKYYQSLTAGRCLPPECSEDRLNLLLQEICAPNFSCLQHANVVPLDFCVSSRFLGCGAAASFAILERMSLIDALSGAHGGKDLQDFHELLSADRLGEFLKQISSRVTDAIRVADPAAMVSDLHADYEGLLGKMMRPFFVPNDLKEERTPITGRTVSFETICTFEPVSRSKYDWYIWTSCMLGLFLILPAAAFLAQKRGRCSRRLRALLSAFSVSDNVKLMLKKRDRYADGTWSHTCGLRVISMLWVVSGHAFAFAGLSVIHNSGAFVDMLSSWTFQGILSGQLAVDTFFFLSGFMLYISGVERIRKTNASVIVTYCRLIFQRWWRLTGLLAFLLIISYYGIQYLNYGPQWPGVTTMLRTGHYGGCTKWWWTNLLYVNNLEWTEGGFSECFPHGWYLACDFQFAIIGTALLFIAAKGSCRAFASIVSILLVVSLGISIYVVAANDLKFPFGAVSVEANSDTRSLQEGAVRSWHLFYVKPWTRIPPYLVGLLAATAHESGRFQKWMMKESPRSGGLETDRLIFEDDFPPGEDVSEEESSDTTLVVMAHTFFGILMLALVYILPFEANRHGAAEWNRVLEVIYMGCQRCVWACCIAWFTLTLAHVPLRKRGSGSGLELNDSPSRIAKTLLSGPLVALLSLGAYGTYLVHPLIQMAYYGSSRQSSGLTEGVGYIIAISQTALALLIGAALHLFVEIPLARIL